MKRLLVSVFALSLAAPAWAQDVDPDDAVAEQQDVAPSSDNTNADDGPSEDEIGALLDLLDASETDDDVPSDTDLESLLRLDDADDPEAEDSESGTIDDDSNDTADAEAGTDPEADVVADDTDAATDTAEIADEVGSVPDDVNSTDEIEPAETDPVDEPTNAAAESDADGTDESGEDDNATDDAGEPGVTEENHDASDAEPVDDPSDTAETDIAADGNDENDTNNDVTVDADNVEAGLGAELTPGASFLTSDEYIALRAESLGEQLELVWSIRREDSNGEPIGETSTRTLYMAPDFVRDETDSAISIFDFLTDRHLEIDSEAETLLNTGFAGEVRRRLDTYLRLSQGGRLQDIPISADSSFDRFWLEAAMGIRREPVSLTHTLTDGELSVERRGGLVLMTATFNIDAVDATEDASEVDDESDPATAESEEDALRRAATPIDLSSDESVVFDPSQAALPINLNLGAARINYPDSLPAEQAQAELFRRWMRHALPIHPDVLSALEGAPHIPTAFSYYIISPESPTGRREIWTLESIETIESGLRLEAGLSPQYSGPDWIGDSVVPAAIAVRDAETTFDIDAMLQEIEQRRDADDNIGAYLVSLQEQHHFGPCPTLAEAELRAVCSATSSVVASGLGDSGFEALFGVLSGPSPSGDETLIETLQPYLDDDGFAGAAARILTAKALLRWAARDPDGVPDDHSPFDLFAEAIEIDPLAGAAWWEAGNALLVQRDPLGAWTVFDTGRAILPEGMIQVVALEDRLRVLAPDFFLPR